MHITNLREHLISRGMNPDLYLVYYDNVNSVVTFMLHNGAGMVVGYQKYNPNTTNKKNNDPQESRYYTYLPTGVDGVFGMETYDPDKKDIYIVEGIFKAAVLHRLGYNAFAVLSNHPKRMKPWFNILKATHNLIAIGDNDAAGAKLVSCVGSGMVGPADLDEMADTDIVSLLGTAKTR